MITITTTKLNKSPYKYQISIRTEDREYIIKVNKIDNTTYNRITDKIKLLGLEYLTDK